MELKPQAHPLLLVAGLGFGSLFLGSWIWYWTVIRPPTWVGWAGAGVGTAMGLTYCLDRLRHWDVRTWQWRNAERNRP